MKVFFWIPWPLYFHIVQLQHSNASYYRLNGHWLLYLIRRSLSYMKVASLIEKDTSIYFSKIRQIRTNQSAALQRLMDNLRRLANLTQVEYKSTFGNNIEQIESNIETIEKPVTANQLNQGTFTSLDVLENDLAASAKNRLNNENSSIQNQVLPPPLPMPDIEVIQPEILASPLITFKEKAIWFVILSNLVLLGEVFVFEKVLKEVFKLTSGFYINLFDVNIFVSKALLMALVIPLISLAFSYFIHTVVLAYLNNRSIKRFKQFYLISLITMSLILLGNGLLFFASQSRESNLKELLVLNGNAKTIETFEKDNSTAKTIEQEIKTKQLKLKEKSPFFEVLQYILIGLYSSSVVIIVGILHSISEILQSRNRLLKAIEKDRGIIQQSYNDERQVHSDYKIHLGLVAEIQLKIQKIIILTNHYFYSNKNNKTYEN